MTQTQTLAKIITERLPWRAVTSEGKEVKKPEGYSELETLLILHKSEIRVEIVEPKPQ